MKTYKRNRKGEFVEKFDWKEHFIWMRNRSAVIVIGALMLTFLGTFTISSDPMFYVSEAYAAEQQKDAMKDQIEGMKADVIDTLMKCESAGHSEDAGVIKYDNDKKGTLKGKDVWSLGQFQWKIGTVQHFVKLRDGKAITNKEAVMLALDTAQARELASWVIFETKGGIFHWENCAIKHGLVEKVTTIKELSA